MKKIICMKRIMSLAALVSMAVSCFGAVEAAAEGPEIVKKYYVNTAFEPTAEAPDGSWDGWTVRDDAGYPASNAGFAKGAASISGSGDNTYAAFQQTAGNGWMITKTLDAPMTGKVIFEADVNTGTVTHKTNRSLFTISQKGATGQIPLLLTSYGYFRSPKVSSAQDQVLLYPLDTENKWVHVKIELDFATGDIAYYFNGGEKATVSGDGKNTPVPASIAGDTFKTSYAYDTIKMYGGGGAALTTGLDNIQIFYEEQKQPEPEPETGRTYYIDTAFAGDGDAAWDVWSRRDNADYPAANGTIREEQGDPYASFASDGSGGWFISADSPRVFTGEVTFETRVRYSGMGAEPGYNRNLFVISDNDDGQVALINNSKSGFFKTAMSIGGSGTTSSQLMKRVTENTWHTLKATVNFDTGAVQYSVDGALITEDGNSGAPIKTMLKEHAGNFDVSKPYHTIKLYMAKGETAVTDVDYIKVYKEERLCEGSAYLVTADELGEHRRRIYHLAPGELQGVATLANTEKTPIQPVVLMGLYKNGCLVAADSARTEEPIQPGAVQEVVCGLKLDLAEGESIAPYEVKMFVWRDTESLEPLGRIPLHLTPDCADEGVN